MQMHVQKPQVICQLYGHKYSRIWSTAIPEEHKHQILNIKLEKNKKKPTNILQTWKWANK